MIAVDQFMEKDHEGQSHWIPLGQYMVIQGLLAERKNEQRVYVVTVETPPGYAWIHDRWPMSMANRIEPVLAIKIEPLFQGYDA